MLSEERFQRRRTVRKFSKYQQAGCADHGPVVYAFTQWVMIRRAAMAPNHVLLVLVIRKTIAIVQLVRARERCKVLRVLVQETVGRCKKCSEIDTAREFERVGAGSKFGITWQALGARNPRAFPGGAVDLATPEEERGSPVGGRATRRFLLSFRLLGRVLSRALRGHPGAGAAARVPLRPSRVMRSLAAGGRSSNCCRHRRAVRGSAPTKERNLC